jgi:hypothetical protein
MREKEQQQNMIYLLPEDLPVIYCAAESSTKVKPSNALSNDPK